MLNPFVRQFLVGWITVLDSVPDIDMLGFLPDFLDGMYSNVVFNCLFVLFFGLFCCVVPLPDIGVAQSGVPLMTYQFFEWPHCNFSMMTNAFEMSGLFNMLSDPSHEIRQQADSALSEFLLEIKNAPVRWHNLHTVSFVLSRVYKCDKFCSNIHLF